MCFATESQFWRLGLADTRIIELQVFATQSQLGELGR